MQEGVTASGAMPPGGAERPPEPEWTAVILTGGASRRMGRDKAGAPLGERTLLDHVLAGVGAATGRPVVIVGPQPDLAVHPWHVVPIVCREDPPGGGPAAAVAAALPHVGTPMLGLIATDMPLAGELLAQLACVLAEHPDAAAVVPLDAGGRAQPLAAVYRTEALRAATAAAGGDFDGAPLRTLLGGLATLHVEVTDDAGWRLRDLDTPADLAWAEARHTRHRRAPEPPIGRCRPRTGILDPDEKRTTMDKTTTWVSTAAQALDIESEIDTQTVLDVARDVAHGVERPAAPLTTYLLGVAVGRGADPVEAAATIRGLLDDAGA